MFSSRRKFAIRFWVAYLFFITIFMYEAKKEPYKNSEKRKAVVTGTIEQRKKLNGSYHYPEFQFVYNDSTYVSSDKLFWTSGWEPGDKLTVIFPKGQPEKAIIYTFVSYWIYMPALLISFMICFFIFAMIVIIKWGEGYSMFQ